MLFPKSIAQSELLEQIEIVQVSENTFALHNQNKVFYVGEIFFQIIKNLKENKEYPEIQQLISTQFNINLSRQKFDDILEVNLKKIDPLTDAETSKDDSYVYGQVKLIREDLLFSISQKLKFLFKKATFILLFTFSFLITLAFALEVYDAGLFENRTTAKDGIVILLSSYLFFALLGLFHEFGHATAAAKFGIKSKEVGLGFYLVFPVLYTDVSKIWLLSKQKRLLVNIGGIYFQLLINIILFLVYWLVSALAPDYQHIIASLFITNALVALYSLNPFFRNDGYWIYSDLFDISNLSTNSRELPINVWHYFKGKLKLPVYNSSKERIRDGALVIYTLAKWALISFIWHWTSQGFYHSIQQAEERWNHLVLANGDYSFESVTYFLKVILFLVLFIIVVIRAVRKYLKNRSALPLKNSLT